MEILQIVGIGLIATILIITLKIGRPEIAFIVSIATSILICMLIIKKLSYAFDLIFNYAKRVNLEIAYISTLLKVIGISYIAEYGAQVCKDAGEGGIATKIELAAKVLIFLLAIPIITSMMELIIKIMP